MSDHKLKDQICLIVEDQEPSRIFIEGMVASAFPGISVEAVKDLRQAKLWLERFEGQGAGRKLGLVIVDLGLPDGCGIEIIRLLAGAHPSAHSLVYTIYDDDSYLFDALAAGARGYLLKDENPGYHVEVLRRVENGEPLLSPSVARRMLKYFHEKGKADLPVEKTHLTPREKEVLVLLTRGLTIPEAAQMMKLSPQTVASYVKIIYQKLHVSNRVELVREAARRKLV